MLICYVSGLAVSTIKDPRLTGYTLLVCQPANPTGRTRMSAVLAVDTVGAGEGDLVAVVTGAPAMAAAKDAPVDAAVVAILDEVRADDLNMKGKSAKKR